MTAPPPPPDHAWQDQTLVTILTTDREPFRSRAKRCAERAAAAGFSHIRMHVGVDIAAASQGKSLTKQEVSRIIIDEHKRALQALQRAGLDRKVPYHLLLEDDCTFVKPSILRARTQQALLDAARDHPDWKILNLGFVSLTPFLPQRGPLVAVPAPWGAHATLFRASAIPSIVALPWHRGEVVEGWTALPLHQRLCVSPPVAFQETMPRESPLQGDFQRITNAWNLAVNLVPCVVILFFIVILSVWVGKGLVLGEPTGKSPPDTVSL